MDVDVHGDGHVYQPLREHAERGLDSLDRIRLLQRAPDRIIVKQARSWDSRERTGSSCRDGPRG